MRLVLTPRERKARDLNIESLDSSVATSLDVRVGVIVNLEMIDGAAEAPVSKLAGGFETITVARVFVGHQVEKEHRDRGAVVADEFADRSAKTARPTRWVPGNPADEAASFIPVLRHCNLMLRAPIATHWAGGGCDVAHLAEARKG